MWSSIGLKRISVFVTKSVRAPPRRDESEFNEFNNEKKGLSVLFEEIRTNQPSNFWNQRYYYSNSGLMPPVQEPTVGELSISSPTVGELSISSILALSPHTLTETELQDVQSELSNHIEPNSIDAQLVNGVIKLVSDPEIQDVIAKNPEFQKLVELAYSKETHKHLTDIDTEMNTHPTITSNVLTPTLSRSPSSSHSRLLSMEDYHEQLHNDEIRQATNFCQKCAQSLVQSEERSSNVRGGNAGRAPRTRSPKTTIPEKLVFLACVVFIGALVMKHNKSVGIELIKSCVRSFVQNN